MTRPEEGRNDVEPTLIASGPLTPTPDRPRMRTRWIFAPSPEGWSEFALAEWELERAGWSDHHPHTETNVVISGELHVRCDDGPVVIAATGDTVTVPAGVVGRYWAPGYARMLAIYGPNPEAQDTQLLGYWEL